MIIALGIIICVLAVLLIASVLMQQGKDKRLSGAIAGSADTYFGKTRGHAKDKILSRITTVLSFVFAILVVVLYILVARLYG